MSITSSASDVLLSAWPAAWLEAETPRDRELRQAGATPVGEPAMWLRHSFLLDRPVVRAILYTTALGGYVAWLNGDRANDALLGPEVSAYDHHIFVQCCEVTALLRQGRNVLGLLVGDGYYAGQYYGCDAPSYAFGEPPRRVSAVLDIEFMGGERLRVVTGAGWRISRSDIVSSSLYDGEHVDGFLRQTGWAQPGFDDSGWDEASVGISPSASLLLQTSPPTRILAVDDPTTILTTTNCRRLYDFGHNRAGYCRLQASGPAGAKVTLRFAEKLDGFGRLDQSNLRTAKATDSYTLAGAGGVELFEPHFTYHGFRYVEMDAPPDVEARIQAITIGTDCAATGRLKFPNAPLLQAIHDMTVRSLHSNFVGIPTDCPQRSERAGWLGDILLFADAATFLVDCEAFLRRFLVEVRSQQHPDGGIPALAPLPRGSGPVAPGWSNAIVQLPHILYERYGSLDAARENWSAMRRWMTYVEERNPDGLFRHGRGRDFGDWLSPEGENGACGPGSASRTVIATAFWARDARMMAELAEQLDHAEDAARYAKLSAGIANAFAQHLIAPNGSVGNGTQTEQAFALAFDLVPEAQRAAAGAHLIASVEGRGNRLATGLLGTSVLLDALADAGRFDLAVSLLLQRDYPSWGYMVDHGATTVWERWDADCATGSHNHYVLGSVTGFLFRRVAGITPTAPGFAAIRLVPRYDARIGDIEVALDSVAGPIRVRMAGDTLGPNFVSANLPPNVTAELVLPPGEWAETGKDVAGPIMGPASIHFAGGSRQFVCLGRLSN